ncbi:MAG: hypothetical protein R3F62_00435 [Planctomycetota bacterium]
MKTVLPLCLLALSAGASFALEPAQVFALTSRSAGTPTRDVRLELYPKGWSGFTVKRITKGRSGAPDQILFGAARLKGRYLGVRFAMREGVENQLAGQNGAGDITGVYRIDGRQVMGVLQNPTGVQGWSQAYDRGWVVAPDPTPARPAEFSPAGNAPFKRVVLCMDGLPHRIVQELRQKEGLFAEFHDPARMITVFPSLSSISWNTLLGLPAEPGYQAVYFSNRQAATMGVTLRKMKGSRFQTRMHMRHEGIVGHGLAYVLPYRLGTRQIHHMLEELVEHEGSRTAFLYAYQTDPIAHMDGRENLEKVIRDIDGYVREMCERYQQKYGEKLEVVIVSDHGHTLQSGELVKLGKHLEAAGWEVKKKVEQDNQCAFSSAGILSSIALHCREAQESELAAKIISMEGVDVVTFDVGGQQQYVYSPRGTARFVYDPSLDAYAYEVLQGQDPLGYGAVYAGLEAEGKLHSGRWATGRDLLAVTADHAYPDAAHRIRVGHTELVRNPANVIVSLLPGYENGQGIVKFTAGLRGRSGTHGGLDQVNSAGTFMTNYLSEPPAVIRAEDLRHYVDLGDYLRNDPPIEATVLPNPAPGQSGGEMWVEFLDDTQGTPIASLPRRFEVVVKRARLLRDKTILERTFTQDELRREHDTWLVPLEEAFTQFENGKTYKVTVRMQVLSREGNVVTTRERKLKLAYRGSHQTFD